MNINEQHYLYTMTNIRMVVIYGLIYSLPNGRTHFKCSILMKAINPKNSHQSKGSRFEKMGKRSASLVLSPL